MKQVNRLTDQEAFDIRMMMLRTFCKEGKPTPDGFTTYTSNASRSEMLTAVRAAFPSFTSHNLDAMIRTCRIQMPDARAGRSNVTSKWKQKVEEELIELHLRIITLEERFSRHEGLAS